MATRKIKDAKDLATNELIYFKGHAKATYMSDGRNVEDAINGISAGGGDIDLSPYATKQEVTIGLANKVDKVDGKQLSTEDFTTILKQKLDGLVNYDDTAIRESVLALRGDLDELVSGDTTTAIKTFNEVIAFLSGIEDSENLDNIIASIEQQIASKQNIITDLDAIRRGAALGETAIQEHQDISGKQDVITDLEDIRSGASLGATALQSVPSEYITESELDAKKYLTAIPSEYVTETELSAKNYATTSALNEKVDKVSGKGLSTEDFTTVLKGKLEGLTNYDDTTINNAVSSLQTQINTLVSGNANDAINSFNEIIAFLDGIKDTQDLASIIAAIEQQIASKMDKVTLATVATSGSYNDLSNKPTIPSAVTESTVSDWGFTKNTGTYSKPSGGIPKSDLDSSVQTSLGKADTALQSYTEQYKGTVTGVKVNGSTKSPSSGTVDIGNVVTSVKINGSSKSPSSGVVDLGTVITAHQDISGKQDKLVSGTSIKTVNGESLLGSGDITISGGSGGGSTSIIDTASSATQTTPKMLITLTKYSSTTPDGFVEGSFFTVDFTSKSISASTAGYPYWINVGGTHYKCVTSAGVEMTKNNYATLTGYYTFVRVGTNFVLVNESSSSANSSAYPIVNHGTGDTTFTLTPNTYHVWDIVGSLTITLGSETSGVMNEYLFQFVSGSYPTSLSVPVGVIWVNGEPEILANKKYQVSILDGMAIVCECDYGGLNTDPE